MVSKFQRVYSLCLQEESAKHPRPRLLEYNLQNDQTHLTPISFFFNRTTTSSKRRFPTHGCGLLFSCSYKLLKVVLVQVSSADQDFSVLSRLMCSSSSIKMALVSQTFLNHGNHRAASAENTAKQLIA